MLIHILLLLPLFRAFAWDSHHLITDHTFSESWKQATPVTFTPLSVRSRLDLCLRLKIHKGWTFPLRLGETPGKTFKPLEILSKYSDEPDWGPDQNLFDEDQYPELWTPDLKYVTQRKGLKSQAFRHQYYPGQFSWTAPLQTFQIPQHPLGEAPDRAILYRDLARQFFNAGLTYWGYRFLGWSLHYIQDLFQPFHSCQTPSKKFIAFNWKGWLPGIDVETTGENIGYYHFAFEEWTDHYLKETNSALAEVLKGKTTPNFDLTKERILGEVVSYSGSLAPTVGSACMDVFPKWDSKKDPLHRKAEDVVHASEWYTTVKTHPKMKDFCKITEDLFRKMAEFCRSAYSHFSSFKRTNGKPPPALF